MTKRLITVKVLNITREAEGVVSLALAPVSGEPLPAFAPGAHVDVHLAEGLVRSYSLCSPASETEPYLIAVNKDGNSRGDSIDVHEKLQASQTLNITEPANNFVLIEDSEHSVL